MTKRLRSLILSANYSSGGDAQPEMFLRSLRALGTPADLVLISNHGGAGVKKHLQEIVPTVNIWVPVPNQWNRALRRIALAVPIVPRWLAGWLRQAWRRHPERRPEVERRAVYLLNITCSRYLLAKRYLSQVFDRYDQVMVTDSRDVILQRDPFADLPSGVTTGEESGLVKEQQGNCDWLAHLYGDDPQFPMASVLQQKVICSGVTLGDTAFMRGYLEQMCAEFMEKLPRLVHQQYLDQGAHIGLLRTGRVPGARLTPNGADCIATLATSDLSEFTVAPSGALLAGNGVPVAIVHQYDRHAELAKRLLARIVARGSSEGTACPHLG